MTYSEKRYQIALEVMKIGMSTFKDFVSERLATSSVELADALLKVLGEKEENNDFMECSMCHKKKEDVCFRPDEHEREIGTDTNAMHVACDVCDEENTCSI